MARRSEKQDTSHNNRWSRANLGFHIGRTTLLRRIEIDPASIPTAPVVIGAIGGSGTRILTQVLHLAGFWMGAWINPSTQDAMATRYFLQQRFEDILRSPETRNENLDREFRHAIGAHRWGMPDRQAPWGWKNPRNVWVLPFLARQFPNLKFVHLLRDGRDMALSRNDNLLRKHGDLLLPERDWRADPVQAQLQLWTLGNRRAREAGQRLLGAGYLMLRYEDLCAQPEQALGRLFEFLDLAPELNPEAARIIQPSQGISRWRTNPHPALVDLEPSVVEALGMFGYA